MVNVKTIWSKCNKKYCTYINFCLYTDHIANYIHGPLGRLWNMCQLENILKIKSHKSVVPTTFAVREEEK